MGESPNMFSFFRSYHEAAKALEPEDQGVFYRALVDYVFDGTEPSLSGVLLACFELARPNLNKSLERQRAGAKGGSSTSKAKRTAARANGFKPKTNGLPAETSQEAKQKPSKSQAKAKQKPSDKEKEKEKEKEKTHKVERFSPPTLEEVRAYCDVKQYSFDPDTFFAYYDSQGWRKANGRPVTNWRQCCVTWEGKRRKSENDGFKVYDGGGQVPALWEADGS